MHVKSLISEGIRPACKAPGRPVSYREGFFDCENLVGSMLESQLETWRSIDDRSATWRPAVPMLSHMAGGKAGVA
jgi:hypothetical protein